MSEKEPSKPGWWRSIGFVWAAAFWFGLIGVGWIFVTTPETGRHSHLIGWVSLTIGFTVMMATMDRWIHYAQVPLGFGIIGGLAMFARGHSLNSDTHVPRATSAALVVLLIGCSLIVWTLARRRLRAVDRLALAAFVAVFASALGASAPYTTLLRLAGGFAILLALWAYHRYWDDSPESGRSTPHARDASDLGDA